MGIVDNYHSLFTFSSSSWVVLIWLVSLPLQSLRSFTGKTTDSGPGCCCGRYRFLTSKATASIWFQELIWMFWMYFQCVFDTHSSSETSPRHFVLLSVLGNMSNYIVTSYVIKQACILIIKEYTYMGFLYSMIISKNFSMPTIKFDTLYF